MHVGKQVATIAPARPMTSGPRTGRAGPVSCAPLPLPFPVPTIVALRSTVFKIDLQLADIDHAHYADHALTIARHPSENDERMMVRVLAYALHAHEMADHGEESLAFGEGIADPEQADLWLRDRTGQVVHWIDVGQPDERLLRKASHQSERVSLYAFGRTTDVWWGKAGRDLLKLRNLSVWRVEPDSSLALAGLVKRTMRVQATINEGQVWLGTDAESVPVGLRKLAG